MDVYIYRAALYCESCATEIMAELRKPATLFWDSDDYPVGPYPDGGGESDAPAHCDRCGDFLENALTTDGENYVKRTVNGQWNTAVLAEWREFYDYLFPVDWEDER